MRPHDQRLRKVLQGLIQQDQAGRMCLEQLHQLWGGRATPGVILLRDAGVGCGSARRDRTSDGTAAAASPSTSSQRRAAASCTSSSRVARLGTRAASRSIWARAARPSPRTGPPPPRGRRGCPPARAGACAPSCRPAGSPRARGPWPRSPARHPPPAAPSRSASSRRRPASQSWQATCRTSTSGGEVLSLIRSRSCGPSTANTEPVWRTIRRAAKAVQGRRRRRARACRPRPPGWTRSGGPTARSGRTATVGPVPSAGRRRAAVAAHAARPERGRHLGSLAQALSRLPSELPG